jgi:hypothetical protein
MRRFDAAREEASIEPTIDFRDKIVTSEEQKEHPPAPQPGEHKNR